MCRATGDAPGSSWAWRPSDSTSRVVDWESARRFVAGVRRRGGRVALTNGCFDLLHAGHVQLLEQARALADALVVAVNSDAGVRALKGPGRPVQPAADRARVVAALRAVDRVVVFEELTAERVLHALRPDIYVKGEEYRDRPLPERGAAEAVGAQVVLVSRLAGRSTSAMVRRMTAPPPATPPAPQAAGTAAGEPEGEGGTGNDL